MGKVMAAVLVAGALVFSAIALSARATSSGPREIRLVVRDMNFYIEGQADPNPTLRMRRGETVRLLLRNDDEGMKHDFAIPDWNAATRRIDNGQEASVTFRAPDRPGSGTYQCRPHGAIMRGRILIE